MKQLLKKLRMFFGIGLTEEERAEVQKRAKEYAYKHTFQTKED